MNNRILYRALSVIIRLLLRIATGGVDSGTLFHKAAVLAEECEALADGRKQP